MLHGWDALSAQEKETIARGIASGNVHGGPYHIELSPTDSCNYDCFFCNQGFIDRKKSLSIERLHSLIDELSESGLKTLRLSGGGEPLLHPKITDFLDHLKQHGIVIHNVTTNGFMLTAAIVERLMALPTGEIIVSLNESDPERYGEMMRVRPRSFHRVVKLIRELVQTRDRLGRKDPRLIVQYFVWKKNFRDIERMMDLAREIGADAIYLRDIYGLQSEERLTEEERGELLRLIAPIAESEPKDRLGIDFGFEKVVLPGRQERPETPQTVPCQAGRDKYCYIGWYSATIRGNGAVYPCCILQQDPKYPPLGNILEQSFQAIWQGPAYRAFRRELRAIALQRGKIENPSRMVHTRSYCAAEAECPLLYALCDEEFYASMNSRLERRRHGLLGALARATGTRL